MTNMTFNISEIDIGGGVRNLNEFEIISKYCSNLGTVIDQTILLLLALYLIILLIEFIELIFKTNLYTKEMSKAYFNILIIPLAWMGGRILIYHGVITETILNVLKIILFFVIVLIGIYAWTKGYIKMWLKYLNSFKDDEK